MAEKAPYESVDELFADLDELLARIPGHPMEWLCKEELNTVAKQAAFASATVKILIEVDPEFPAVCTTKINLDRALQVESGDPGICHVLQLGIEKVANSTMSVFWHGLSPPAKLIRWLKRSWEEGLDTTQRSFKLCVGRDTCLNQISDKLMFAGYAGGSTLGSAQTLGMFLFLQLPKELRATPGPRARPGVGMGSGPFSRARCPDTRPSNLGTGSARRMGASC